MLPCHWIRPSVSRSLHNSIFWGVFHLLSGLFTGRGTSESPQIEKVVQQVWAGAQLSRNNVSCFNVDSKFQLNGTFCTVYLIFVWIFFLCHLLIGAQSRSELRDLQSEFQREKEDLLDIIREQGKQVRVDWTLVGSVETLSRSLVSPITWAKGHVTVHRSSLLVDTLRFWFFYTNSLLNCLCPVSDLIVMPRLLLRRTASHWQSTFDTWWCFLKTFVGFLHLSSLPQHNAAHIPIPYYGHE